MNGRLLGFKMRSSLTSHDLSKAHITVVACLYTSVLALTPAAMALPAPWSSHLNMLVWVRIFSAARYGHRLCFSPSGCHIHCGLTPAALSLSRPKTRTESALMILTWATVLGAIFGAVPTALDWGRVWQSVAVSPQTAEQVLTSLHSHTGLGPSQWSGAPSLATCSARWSLVSWPVCRTTWLSPKPSRLRPPLRQASPPQAQPRPAKSRDSPFYKMNHHLQVLFYFVTSGTN